jgi:hypothetical protein
MQRAAKMFDLRAALTSEGVLITCGAVRERSSQYSCVPRAHWTGLAAVRRRREVTDEVA